MDCTEEGRAFNTF